jgi:hypothetical protein
MCFSGSDLLKVINISALTGSSGNNNSQTNG